LRVGILESGSGGGASFAWLTPFAWLALACSAGFSVDVFVAIVNFKFVSMWKPLCPLEVEGRYGVRRGWCQSADKRNESIDFASKRISRALSHGLAYYPRTIACLLLNNQGSHITRDENLVIHL